MYIRTKFLLVMLMASPIYGIGSEEIKEFRESLIEARQLQSSHVHQRTTLQRVDDSCKRMVVATALALFTSMSIPLMAACAANQCGS